MEKTFNCAPVPNSLRSKQNQDWSFVGALSELVDNSFGPGRGDASSVIISYDSKLRTLKVVDNGRGMDVIGHLFQHGTTAGRSIGDIGEYGAGGTMALLWCAKFVRIWSLRDGLVQSDAVTWERWFTAKSTDEWNVSDEWKRATINNTPSLLLTLKHGTYIEMLLPAKRHVSMSNIIRDLSKMYATGLRRGKSITVRSFKDGELIYETRLVDPFRKLVVDTQSVGFDAVISYNGEHLPFSGMASYSKETTVNESKIQIGYGFRNILATNECYRSRDGSEKFVGTGVSGWIDLGEGWQPYLTTTKNAIDDAPLFKALMEHIFHKIKPLLKIAQNETYDIIFEDLAIGLEDSLNRQGKDFIVRTTLESGDQDPKRHITKRGSPGPKEWPDNNRATGLPGEKEAKGNPQFRLAIIPTDDHALSGALCQAQVRGDQIIMLVNRDHEYVKAASVAKPINKMALNLMIVSELSETLMSLPERESIVKRLFPHSTALTINSIDDARSRARFVTRQLIDRVRTPAIDEPREAA